MDLGCFSNVLEDLALENNAIFQALRSQPREV